MTQQEMDRNKRLALYDGPDRVENAAVLYAEELKKPQQPCYPLGLPGLDRLLKGGAYAGQLIVISGVTGHGKTTLAQTVTVNLLHKFVKSMWFSFEVGTKDFLEQFDTSYHHHFYMPMENVHSNIKWVEERIIESYLKYDTKAVFIDHLHRVVSPKIDDNLSARVGTAVIELKKMAVKHNMMMFVMCHTDKYASSSSSDLGLGSVRDSSLIEQEADTVLYVWRDPNDKFRTVVKLAKNRKGGAIDDKFALRLHGNVYHEEEFTDEDSGNDSRDRSRMGQGKKGRVSKDYGSRYDG